MSGYAVPGKRHYSEDVVEGRCWHCHFSLGWVDAGHGRYFIPQNWRVEAGRVQPKRPGDQGTPGRQVILGDDAFPLVRPDGVVNAVRLPHPILCPRCGEDQELNAERLLAR